MLIVEGPDGSGKSTLVRALSAEFKLDIEPRACTSEGGPVENLADWVDQDLRSRVMSADPPSLHDRYPLISEMIYGPAIRGSLAEGFDDPTRYPLWLMRLSRIAVVIWCMPSYQAVSKNLAKDDAKHMPGVIENSHRIYGGYLAMRAIWPRLVRSRSEDCQVTWNYETDDLSYLFNRVRQLEVSL